MANIDLGDIPIIVLRTPDSNRYKLLDIILKELKDTELIYLNSVMCNSYEQIKDLGIQYIQSKFILFENRKMLPGEIACAFTHNLGREILAQSKFGGVILEDDARIQDVNLFFEQISSFLNSKYSTNSVLNLTGLSKEKIGTYGGRAHRFIRLRGSPDLAVGYALTRGAADALVTSNNPISYVADWPDSKCSFFIPNIITVAHGDINTSSLIDSGDFNSRINVSKWHKFKLFSLFLYFSNRRWLTFSSYIRYVYFKRILRNIDLFVTKLVRKLILTWI